MVDVRYLFVDEATGDPIAELPLSVDGAIPFRKNEPGQFSASMPCDHPAVTKANLTGGLRSITVLRDDSAEMSALVSDIDVDSANRQVNLSLVEASAYFDLRTVEVHEKWTATDRFDIVRDVFTEITTKTSTAGDGTGAPGTDILAGIPNFSVAAGTSGFTMDLEGAGRARLTMADYLEKLAEDPDEGIEWCMDYQTGSTRQSCLRTVKLGAPLGVTQSIILTEQMLASWGHTFSPLRGGTRWHTRGKGHTSTKQNTGSISDGWPLIEQSVDRPNVSNTTHLDNITREFRRKGQEPVKMLRLSYAPGLSLPFGWCGIGDKLSLDVNDPCDLLNLNADNRRVESIDWYPPQAGQRERVDLLTNLPLDETGA